MSWKGAATSPDWRHNLVRGIQVVISMLALTVLIYFTQDEPELALTFYFVYGGPIVVAAYTWGKEIAGLLILAVVSYFVPVLLGAAVEGGTAAFSGDFAHRVLEMTASVVFFGVLTVIGERAGKHRRQRDRYRELDRIGERLSRELQIEDLLQVILDQTVPLFRAAGGEIVLRDEQTRRLEMVAAVGVSQDAQTYLQRHAYADQAGVAGVRDTLAELILRQNKPFLHNHLKSDPRYVYGNGDTPLLDAQVRSVLAVPLRRGDESFGLLSLFNKDNGGFDQADVDFLTTVAEKSAIAIENARLYQRTDASLARRVEELSILNQIAQMLVTSLDLDLTIESILEALHNLFPDAIAEICLWDPVEQVMRTYAQSGEGGYARATDGFYRIDEGYSGWIARHRKQLWIPDIRAQQDVRPKVDSTSFPFRSYVGFPLQVGAQLIGTLEVISYKPNAFPVGTRSMLEALCSQAAVAIQNARLYQERQQRLSEMVGLQQITQAISTVRDVDQVYSMLTERIAQLMNVELCGVLLYDQEAKALIGRPPFHGVPANMVQRYRIPMSEDNPLWHMWEDADYIYVNDVPTSPLTTQVGLKELAAEAGVRATMFAALAAGGRRFGLIQVSNKRDRSPFDESDARLLSIFANQAAVVLENARLYEAEQTRRKALEELQISAAAISAALELESVLTVVVERAIATFRADAACVMIPDAWEQHLVIEAAHGFSDDFVTAYRLPRDEVMGYLEREGTQPKLFTALENRAIIPPDLIESEGISWLAIVPLMSGGEPFGTLYFCGKGTTLPFSNEEMELVALYANQAAVSIQNARLYTQTDERLRLRLNELTVLNRIGQELNATLDMEHILELMLKEAVQATQASHGNVNLMNWDTGALEARAVYGIEPDQLAKAEVSLTLGRGVISRAARTAQPVIVDDVTSDPDYVLIVPETRSELAIPILHRSVVLGVINLESPRPGQFTEAHIEFLETLAAQAAVAISNARIYKEQQERSELLRQRADQLSHLFEIGQTLRADRPLEDVLTEVAFAVQETAGFNLALISVLEGDKQRRIAGAGIPLVELDRLKRVRQPWSDLEAVFQEEFKISNSYYIPYEHRQARGHLDVFTLEESRPERRAGQWHPEDMLLVPLRGSGDTILGIMSVDQPQDDQVPSRATVEVLEIFAAQAALIVENARLVDDLKRRVDELTLFNEVGRSLSARLDFEGLLGTIVEAATELLSAPQSVLFLQDSDQDAEEPVFVPQSAWGYDLEQINISHFRAGEGPVGRVAQTAKAIVIPDTRQEERFRSLMPLDAQAEPGAKIGEEVEEVEEREEIEIEEHAVSSVILAPLIFGGKVIGVLGVEHFSPNAFSSSDITSLSTLADQAAIALENARLFEQSQRQLQEMIVINEIGRALSATVRLDELLGVLRQQVARLVPAESFYVALHDAESTSISFPLFLRAGEQVEIDPIADTQGLTGHIIQTGQPLLLRANAPQRLEELGLPWKGHVARSYLGVPMTLGEKVVGVIAVQDFERDYIFDLGHERALSTVAVQAAIAIENARLFEEVRSYQDELEQRVEERTRALEQERDRVETLYRITSELGTSLDLDRVLNRALSLLLNVTQSERGSIFMIDQPTDRIRHRVALWSKAREQEGHESLPIGGVLTRFRRGEGLAGWVMQMRRPTIVKEIENDPRWTEVEERERWHRSVLAMPLVVSDEAMGALLLYHSEVSYFTYEHMRLVEAVAAQVASAINNAELYRYVYESADRLGRMMKAQQVETAKTEAILEGVADGVMVADARGVVIRFNAAAERILNTPRRQVLNRATDELLGLYGTSGAAWAKAVAEWQVSPPRRGEEALLSERLEIEERIVSVRLSPVVMGDEFLGTVSLFRDITQQVELEKAKSEFVSTVSHELRTPMTSIKGYADLLLMGAAGALSDNQHSFLSIIKTNADRLTMLVNDLLDIGRIDSDRIELNLKKTDFASVASMVIDMLKGRAVEKSQTLVADIPDDLPSVLIDRDRVSQVLTNLVGNAQQYTPTGGHITVKARLVTPEMASLEENGSGPQVERPMVEVSVIDDGIGVAPEDQKKIFERFFRSDHPLVQETAGTGLGLPITRSLVEMHGGQLWLESEVGRGSKFSFTLQVAPEHRPSTRDKASEQANA